MHADLSLLMCSMSGEPSPCSPDRFSNGGPLSSSPAPTQSGSQGDSEPSPSHVLETIGLSIDTP